MTSTREYELQTHTTPLIEAPLIPELELLTRSECNEDCDSKVRLEVLSV